MNPEGSSARATPCGCRRTRFAGGLLVAVAAPKICCVAPLFVAAYPALAKSATLFGVGTTLDEIDALCAAGGPNDLSWLGPLNLPLSSALALISAGFLLTLLRRRPRRPPVPDPRF